MNTLTDYLASIEAREKAANGAGELLAELVGPEHRRFVTETVHAWRLEHKRAIQNVINSRADIPTLLLLARKYREALEQITVKTGASSTLVHLRSSVHAIANDALNYDPREEQP